MLHPRYHADGRSTEQLNRIQTMARDSHLKKLRDGTYSSETAECPICHTFQDQLLSEKDRYGFPLSVVICCNCGLIRTNPRLSAQDYEDFYRTEYRSLYGGSPVPTPAFFNDQRMRGTAIQRFIDGNRPTCWNGLLVIEVGCGAGGVLLPFAEAGAEVIGCDFADDFLQYGIENHRLDLRKGRFCDLPLPRAPDLVIYSHVLEHILNVRAELQLLRRIIKPEGRLFIEIPSIKGIHRAYGGDFLQLLQNAHTFHFSLRSLTNLVGLEGFTLERGNEQVQALYTSGPIQAPVSDYIEATKFLRRAEYLRFINPLHPFRLRAALRRTLNLLRIKDPLSRLFGRAS